jgi:hypothetical protein
VYEVSVLPPSASVPEVGRPKSSYTVVVVPAMPAAGAGVVSVPADVTSPVAGS